MISALLFGAFHSHCKTHDYGILESALDALHTVRQYAQRYTRSAVHSAVTSIDVEGEQLSASYHLAMVGSPMARSTTTKAGHNREEYKHVRLLTEHVPREAYAT